VPGRPSGPSSMPPASSWPTSNKSVVEIARRGDLIFEAVVPSEEVGDLRVGMPVRIKLDAFDYQRYGTVEGSVGFISPDSGVADPRQGEPPAKPVFYTVKIRLPRLEVGRGTYQGRVKLGMAGVAEVVTDRESLLSLLVQRIRRTISLG
jgi:multidrug resistance efflux pump